MSFLSPWFLLGMLAVGVPVVLHLLARQRTTDVRLPTWQFLDGAPVESTRRRRPADLLLLALRAAVVLLLALLFARPFLPAHDEGRLLVLALDTSGSMSAPATWASAQAAIERRLDAREGGRVALVAFDHAVRTLIEPTSDAAAVRRAAEGALPNGGRGSLDALMAFVATAWPGEPVTLVVVSDLQQDDSGRTTARRPALLDVEVEPVDPARENLSVEDLVRRAGGADIVVRNHGAAARTADVAIEIDAKTVAAAAVTLAPGEAARVPVSVSWPGAGVGVARVTDARGVAADNARAVVLEPVPPVAVTLVLEREEAPAGRYLRAALASAVPDVPFDVRVVASGDAPAVRAALAEAGAGDVVVVASTRGLDRALAGAFSDVGRRGGGVLGVAGPDVDVPILLDVLSLTGRIRFIGVGDEASSLLPDDVRHPVLAAFGTLVENLARVDVRRWVDLVPEQGTRVVARLASGRPAFVDVPVPEGRLMLLATDLGRAWNDFPVEPVFVPFVIETLRYLAARRDAPPVLTVADAARPMDGVPGVITLGQPPRRVAVNADPRESVLRFERAEAVTARLASGGDQAGAQRAQAEVAEGRQGIWRAVFLVMALALIAETWLAGQRSARTAPAGGTS